MAFEESLIAQYGIAGIMMVALVLMARYFIQYLDKKDAEAKQRELDSRELVKNMYAHNQEMLKQNIEYGIKRAESDSKLAVAIDKNTQQSEQALSMIKDMKFDIVKTVTEEIGKVLENNHDNRRSKSP